MHDWFIIFGNVNNHKSWLYWLFFRAGLLNSGFNLIRGLFCKSLISEIDILNKDYYWLIDWLIDNLTQAQGQAKVSFQTIIEVQVHSKETQLGTRNDRPHQSLRR